MFDAGHRPRAAHIVAALETVPGKTVPGETAPGEAVPGKPAPDKAVSAEFGPAHVSLIPESDEGWLELVASGLAFDLAGLTPADAVAAGPATFRFGLEPGAEEGWEAVELVPGPHIAGGRAMMPVVRVMAGLAARLAGALPARAVCWRPAGSWMAPDYFGRIVAGWLAGGPFPSLGLTAFERTAAGDVKSAGLEYFTGQELLVRPPQGEAPVDTIKLATRLVDRLVEAGAPAEACRVDLPGGGSVDLEPSADGRLVTARRAG
jgi:hypothetical protein